MSFKPSELYLGIVDIFVLLLPGIILVNGMAWLFAYPLPTSGEWLLTRWLPLSYAVGLGVSTLGSALEDFLSSRFSRSRIENEQKTLAALRTRVIVILTNLFVTPDDLGKNLRRTAAVVGRNLPGEPISRRDADRRFARNAALVMVVLVAALPWAARPTHLLAADIVLPIAAAIAVWRYFDQDRKYSQEVYEWLIVQSALGHVKPVKNETQPTS